LPKLCLVHNPRDRRKTQTTLESPKNRFEIHVGDVGEEKEDVRHLAGFEEEDGHLSEVEVDEVLRLVRNVGAKIAADDAMPSGVVLLVELLLDVARDILLDVVLLQRLSGTVHRVLLHILCHVGIFDHSLAVRHGEFREWARLRCFYAGKILN